MTKHQTKISCPWQLVTVLFLSGLLHAATTYNEGNKTWTLASGDVEYRLQATERGLRVKYFGPRGLEPAGSAAVGTADIGGMIDGRRLDPESLELVSSEIENSKPGISVLHLSLRHRDLPVQVDIRYSGWGDTGVITRHVTLTNQGKNTLHIESLPSLALQLPAGDYELTHLFGSWKQERQVATEPLHDGERVFNANTGRSTCLYSPWFALHNRRNGIRYAGQLAWSGNWRMSFEQQPGMREAILASSPLRVSLGMTFDFGGAESLRAGDSQDFPEVAFTASSGSLDDIANQLHSYQRKYVTARIPANEPPLVQYNTWYPTQAGLTLADMKRSAETAAGLGIEVFVVDGGWSCDKNCNEGLGDYRVDPVRFPRGLEEFSEFVRKRGMKFGLWVEIENIGLDSRMFREHSAWCLAYQGKPIVQFGKCQLDFGKPEVQQWATSVIDRLVDRYKMGWLKIDSNIDIGSEFDPPSSERFGDVFANSTRHYYEFLDHIRMAHPQLIVENCASGGLRMDLGIVHHTHTTWLSDEVNPAASLQLAYGCTLEFTAGICNHWMVGDEDNGSVNPNAPPGWWDFMLRVPMNGQFGISSRIFDWPPELTQRVIENVKLYKRIRATIADASVYHLTPPPDHNHPTGWMALQYISEDRKRSILMAYRAAKSEPAETFHLVNLDPGATYRLIEDGVARGALSGSDLLSKGLTVKLDDEWRAVVIEMAGDPGASYSGLEQSHPSGEKRTTESLH